MASLKVIFTLSIFTLFTINNMVQSRPMSDGILAIDGLEKLTAGGAEAQRLNGFNDASPIVHAGIAHVNGRFGKSIRAFTVNEFEKYIDGLV